jgi:hypothetical protein
LAAEDAASIEEQMRRLIACLAFTGALATEGAAHDVIDLGTTTCRQFLAMNRERSVIVMGWLQGYFLEEHVPPIVDIDKLNADLRKLMDRCESRLDEDVMMAAEMLFNK